MRLPFVRNAFVDRGGERIVGVDRVVSIRRTSGLNRTLPDTSHDARMRAIGCRPRQNRRIATANASARSAECENASNLSSNSGSTAADTLHLYDHGRRLTASRTAQWSPALHVASGRSVATLAVASCQTRPRSSARVRLSSVQGQRKARSQLRVESARRPRPPIKRCSGNTSPILARNCLNCQPFCESRGRGRAAKVT